MIVGRKLALLAASLAGAAVLTWTVVETLRDGESDEQSAAEAASSSPIARMVARMGPPDRAQGVAAGYYAGDARWEEWARAAAAMRAAGDMTGNSDGELGYLRGRSIWDGDQDLDDARGRRMTMSDPAAERARRAREGSVQARSYRVPRSGRPTILTSGRRVGEPHIRLPQNAAVSLGIEDRGQMPMRVEVCVDRAGKPDEVRVIDGTGEDKVDNFVARQLLERRYRPLRHEGRLVGFCERATVIVEL